MPMSQTPIGANGNQVHHIITWVVTVHLFITLIMKLKESVQQVLFYFCIFGGIKSVFLSVRFSSIPYTIELKIDWDSEMTDNIYIVKGPRARRNIYSKVSWPCKISDNAQFAALHYMQKYIFSENSEHAACACGRQMLRSTVGLG